MSKYYGIDKFAEGSLVRVADRAFLENFLQTWKYHHKLRPEQVAYAGQVADVRQSSMYHGGDILYELVGVPGIWHQDRLRAP